MDKQNAIQDLSYIKKLMSETQQIMDIVWPIYIYWGIYFVFSNIIRLLSLSNSNVIEVSFDHALTPIELSMLILIIASWGGLFFSAFYIFRHRQRMFNKKMFLIGMLGLSFLLMYTVISVSLEILWVNFTTQEMISLHNLYSRLIHGLYFSALFIIFGLVYAREQLWMGYYLLLVTIFTIYLGVTYTAIPTYSILSVNVGICFLIAGIMAYRRHRKQVNENKQVITQE